MKQAYKNVSPQRSSYIVLTIHACILTILFPQLIWANSTKFTPKEEFIKTIERNFDASADGIVQLHNKYGSIDISTWERNKVTLKVIIKANARTKDKAQELFDRIHIDISNGNDFVKAETHIESSSWWGNWTKGDYK
ncbi:MAG: hypothetical protein AAF738_11020, partial [Bacteroidota bacterium]